MTDSLLRRPLANTGSGWRWENIDQLAYKATGSAPFRDITRQRLFADDTLDCELRYFEIGPDGHSTLERHQHAHGVMVLNGRGSCLVGQTIQPLGPQTLVTIPPWTWHQFRADADSALGFLCMVNHERDRPALPTPQDLAELRADPLLAAWLRVSD